MSQYAQNELCEVEVYGCQGQYGDDCLYHCPRNCLNLKCDNYKGQCLSCLPGYYGQLCTNACPSGRFGLKCINRCDTYCSGNESCDPVIGICTKGCKQGYKGLMCGLDKFSDRQLCGDNTPFVIGVVLSVECHCNLKTMYGKLMLGITVPVLFSVIHVCALENIALNKPTWQQHPWHESDRDFGSENAVDGFYTDRGTGGQCTINNDGQYTAEWRVDLGNVLSISYINIYYRTQNENPGPYVNRMAGFSLYISNTTSKDQGHCCYKDNSRGKPSVNQNISCSIYGRYVIYYNERRRDNNPSYLSKYAYNELCELEVFGYRGSFGDCCQYPCHKNCIYMGCDAYTGHCRSFIPEHYGQICITGQCEGGCQPGWSGDTCDQWCGSGFYVCESGYYGQNCINQCSINCNVFKICDRVTGKCYFGCKPGWSGNTCDQACPSGLFGLDCTNRCDTYCTGNKSCDPVMGICNEGCKKGWSGLMCGLDGPSNRQPYGDNKPIVIGIVLAVVIVLIGSVINFIYWRRKTEKPENTTQQYAELGKVNKSSNYDELHNYSVFSVK
uniref:Multiple epidermal growth factor-like domains 10 n=1 Tax=Magallana gigas TaxID=29159 RepID=A0A8W8NUC7_MAGGI